MGSLNLDRPYITLAQAIKAAALVGSGGEAKELVRSGIVEVNGTIEQKPGRKLQSGDRFRIVGHEEWTVDGA